MDQAQRAAIREKIEQVAPATVATWLASLPSSWRATMASNDRCVMAQFFKEYLGMDVWMGVRCVRFGIAPHLADGEVARFQFAMAPPWIGDYVTLLMDTETDEVENEISAPSARATWDHLDLSNDDLSTGQLRR